jgi:sulfate adenylyltransferase
MGLVSPHGGVRQLKPLLLDGAAKTEVQRRAQTLAKIPLSSREVSDLLMLGIGAYTPLEGFMDHDDWKSVCADLRTAAGVFWPVPITLSTTHARASELRVGQEVALVDAESGELVGCLELRDIYRADKRYECKEVFGTVDPAHPGVAAVLSEGDVNLAGPVAVLSEGSYPDRYPEIYLRPEQTRAAFAARGWSTVAGLQLRNPMHRSHEYLAKIAIEVCDGLLVHQKLGKLKPGDVPAEVRVEAVNAVVQNYFVKNTCIQAGVPIEMRYAGPREALLDAVFRQNFGCSHLIVGRDHAGVGDFYGPFDAQKIFDQIPADALEIKPLKLDWTFYCYKCDGMASARTCPHGVSDRLMVSGTMLRKTLSEGGQIPDHFSRPEALEILRKFYTGQRRAESDDSRRR